MDEDFFADFRLQIQETLSCCKVLQQAVKADEYIEDIKILDDTLEIVIEKLTKIVREANIIAEEIFNQ